jgi:hypothetical protein
VTIDGSGHMVPQDEPEVALYMLERWLDGRGRSIEVSIGPAKGVVLC